MGNKENENNSKRQFNLFHNKGNIIVLLSILLAISIITIAVMVINYKNNSSFFVIKDRDKIMEAYKISSYNTEYIHEVNCLRGEVSELYASYAEIVDEKGYSYSIDMTNNRQLKIGDRVLVFYSQLSPEEIAPAQFEEQYEYIVINDIASL